MEENIKPIDVLLKNNCDLAAAKLIFSVVDTLAGFSYGRLSQEGKVRKSFIKFLEKYSTQFFKHDLSQLCRNAPKKKDRKTFNNYAEILFFIFRNGLIHDSSLQMGVSVYRDENSKILFKSVGTDIMELNIVIFYNWFKDALAAYENDLKTKNSIYKKWLRKYQEIISPVFKLDIEKRIIDDLNEKGRITSRKVAEILNQSQSTALRVLNIMVKKKLIIRKGASKSTYYELRK